DMGTPEDFVRGSSDLVRGIAPSPALQGQRGEKLVHDGAAVAPGAVLIGAAGSAGPDRRESAGPTNPAGAE
ncbi:hypothetical protein BV508_29770, partial [Mycobacterium intermedium]